MKSPASRDTIAIDTTVWIEGLLFGGASEELVKMAMTGRVKLVTSESLIGELSSSLRGPLKFSEKAITQVCGFVRDCSEVIPETPEDSATDGPGPSVLDIATRGGANLIATTNREALLQMGSHEGIPIVRIA